MKPRKKILIGILIGLGAILLIYIFIIQLLFCKRVDLNLANKPEYLSCGTSSDCIPTENGCLNKKGANRFKLLTNLCLMNFLCKPPSSCLCQNNQCMIEEELPNFPRCF